jgi:dienelactone hydrolase
MSSRNPAPVSHRRRNIVLGVCAVLLVVAVVVTVVLLRRPDEAPASAQPEPIPTADLSGSGNGTLVSAMTMPAFAASKDGRALKSARVVYRSTNGDSGQQTVVSGSVFAPTGSAPAGGWPVIAFGHGTTGIDQACAPSLSDNLLGGASLVDGLVHAGYAVALADYQGLGEPGVHPYTDSRTSALNMIDAVRALRRTFPEVSNRFAAVGGSQGGGAAWAVDEQARDYAPDLDLVGAVAFVPAADVTGIVDKAQADTMTPDQQLAFIGIVESLARLHPDVNRDDFRRGPAAAQWDSLAACAGPLVAGRDAAAKALTPADTTPANPQAAERIRQLLSAWAVGHEPLAAPLLVVYAGKDEFIDPQWTTAAVARACAQGGTVEAELQPDKGHGDVDIAARVQWLADRFAGTPTAGTCR